MCTTATPEPVLPSRKRHVGSPLFAVILCRKFANETALSWYLFLYFQFGESAGLHRHGITLMWLTRGQIGLPRKPRELSVPPGVI
jgi:hypothetical protein